MKIYAEQDNVDKNIRNQTQWLDYDIASCNFKDKRLKERFRKLLV